MSLRLLGFDADRVQEFVFRTNNPSIIQASSDILRGLNEWVASDLGRRAGVEVIYSGGGGGVLLCEADAAAGIADDLRGEFARRSKGLLGVTCVHVPCEPTNVTPPNPSSPAHGRPDLRRSDGFAGQLALLGAHMRRAKAAERGWADVDEGPAGIEAAVLERCRYCHTDPAAKEIPSPGGDDRPICRTCSELWRSLKGFDEEGRRTRFDLAEIADGGPGGMVGLLYLDGNDMGGRLQGVADPQALREFSATVCDAYRRAEQAVLDEVLDREGRREDHVSLLGGGDELILVLPASSALRAASVALRTVERIVDDGPPSTRGIGSGGGLVLTPPHMPLLRSLRAAKQLLRSAKRLHYQDPEAHRSTFDFEVLDDDTIAAGNIEVARKLRALDETGQLYSSIRPLSLDDLDRLVEDLEAIRAHDVATSQLYRMLEVSRSGPGALRLFVRYQLARLDRSDGLVRWAASSPDWLDRVAPSTDRGDPPLRSVLLDWIDGLRIDRARARAAKELGVS